METLTPEMFRQFYEQFAIARAGSAPEIARTEDRTIPGPHGDIPVRIYTPEGTTPLPVVVYFHGGGWVLGSIASHDTSCRSIANASGAIVISVDYRLAPESKFPKPLDDAFAAAEWIAENAESFGGDSQRMAIAGDSAGGNLATVVSMRARDAGSPRILFQVLVYPVIDYNFDTPSYIQNAEGYALTRAVMIWFWGHYLNNADEGQNPLCSPMRAPDLSGLPPALIITAEFDPLRDEGEAYAKRLIESGVPVEYTCYDGMIHTFFGIAGLDKAKEALGQVGRALKEAFGTKERHG